MYRAFEFNLKNLCCKNFSLEGRRKIKEWYKAGSINSKKEKTNIEDSLKQIINAETIDGVTLREQVFPSFHRDVFISHSHNDEKMMYIIAGMLQQKFGLTVFADEFFWKSADALLLEIDNQHCGKEYDAFSERYIYSYKDRNLTTSHVHIMLSTAIMEAVNQCEVFLFLSTDNSTLDGSAPDLAERFEDGRYTMSPWIYQELLFASMVKPVIPKRLTDIEKGTTVITEGAVIAYKLPPNLRSIMPQLTLNDLISWDAGYDKDGNIHALDVLYASLKSS